MIIVTGGAGFIGSALIWKLNRRGINDIIVVDHLGESEKWKNLVNLQYDDYIDKEVFLDKVEKGYFGTSIDSILHLGACSSTTEIDADYLMENNFHYTVRLADWSLNHKCRFIYASSAATYGSGESGYSDKLEDLNKLRPLNMYGYSKHLFDKYAKKRGWQDKIVGLKYFNVFGPNEYHKADMRSLVCKSFPKVRDEGKIALFKSHRKEFNDGEQIRDFIYIKDAVEMTLYFLEKRNIGGIFNIGTGQGHTWNELANDLFRASKKQSNIEYIPMPINLREKYQYFTTADISKLRESGCQHTCMSLNDSIYDYVTNYLIPGRYLGDE